MSNDKVRRLATLGAAAGLTLGLGFTLASAATTQTVIAPGYEQVDSIPMLTRPHSWQVIDEDTVVIWATAFQPYLVELAFASHDLEFSQVIGITQVGSRIYAKFDAVKVGGFRYPIASIYKMTREEARDLVRGT